MEFHPGDLVFFKPLNASAQITEVLQTGQILFKRLDEATFGLGMPNQFEKIVDFTENEGIIAMDLGDDDAVLVLSEDGTDCKEGRVLKRLKKRESSIEKIMIVEPDDGPIQEVTFDRVVPNATSVSGSVFNVDIFRRLVFAYKITPRHLLYMSLGGKAWNDRINNKDDIWRMMLERDFSISYTKWVTQDMELHDILKKAIDAYTTDATKVGRRYYKRFYELLIKMMRPNSFSFKVKQDVKLNGKKHIFKVFQSETRIYGIFSSHINRDKMTISSPFLSRMDATRAFTNITKVVKPINSLGINAPNGFELYLLAYDCVGVLFKLTHLGGYAGDAQKAGVYYLADKKRHEIFDASYRYSGMDVRIYKWSMNKQHIVYSQVINDESTTFVYNRTLLKYTGEIKGIIVKNSSGPQTFSIVDFRETLREIEEINDADRHVYMHNVLVKENVNLDAPDQTFSHILPVRRLTVVGKQQYYSEFDRHSSISLDLKEVLSLDTFGHMKSIEQQFKMKNTAANRMLNLSLEPTNIDMLQLTTRQKNILKNQDDDVDFIIDTKDYVIRIYPSTASAGLWGYYTLKKDTVDLVSSQICSAEICANSVAVKCGNCETQTYCSQECATQDWVTHKNNCL